MFLSFRLKPPANKFSPAPSNPHVMASACMPTAICTAMIVEKSPKTEGDKPKLAAESAESIASAIFAPRQYFSYIEALRTLSFSRRNETSAIC